MTNIAANMRTLQLHVSGKKIWYLDAADGLLRCLDVPAEEIFEHVCFRGVDRVQMIGRQNSVELALRLYAKRNEGKLSSVQLCSPLVCRTASERANPAAALWALSNFSMAPSLGGFHEMSESDYAAYSLANVVHLLARSHRDNPKVIDKHLYAHPAWPAISFIKSVNKLAVAGLLAHILDPRWFVDPCKPDSNAKLYSWLGLNPKTQAHVSANAPKYRYHARCRLVLLSWKRAEYENRIRETFDYREVQPIVGDMEPGTAPYDFVWRVWAKRMGFGTNIFPQISDTQTIPDLRASQRFVEFVRAVWLAAIYKNSRSVPDGGASLFRPEDFFRNTIEAQAFEVQQLGI